MNFKTKRVLNFEICLWFVTTMTSLKEKLRAYPSLFKLLLPFLGVLVDSAPVLDKA
jgi:hypothetical protein